MTTTPVLGLPNFSEVFVLKTDASDKGIGAVLAQKGKPLAYMSKAIGPRKRGWSVYSKEMLAIMEAIRLWRPYLLGRRFQIWTDQKSLKFFLEQRVVTLEQQKWVSKLLGYDYEIIYRPGRTNSAADALSRRPVQEVELLEEAELEAERNTTKHQLQAISSPQFQHWDELRHLNVVDPYLRDLREKLIAQPADHPQFTDREGLLLYKGRIVIPPASALCTTLMAEFHNSKVGGHSGVLRTYKRIAQSFYWEAMKKDVRSYVATCDTCQRNKSEARSAAGLLQPLPVPSQVWEEISLDFVDGLPSSTGKTTVMVVVDRLTKYAHFIALTHPYTAKKVAEVFVSNIVRLHGMPTAIVSDRDPIFLSTFWKEFFALQGTQLKMSSAYHPQSDGQTEVVNRCLEQYLRCLCSQHPKTWAHQLPWAEYWYNTTFHQSLGITPFQALYGRPAPTMVNYLLGASVVDEVDRELQDRDELLQQLKINLQKASNRMKQQADKKRRDYVLEVGDWVYLRLHPYRQHSLFRRAHQKLASRFFGPYQILKRVGAVAYELDLPDTARIHPVFHVSLLKKQLGDMSRVTTQLPPFSTDNIPVLQPRLVKDYRWVKQGDKYVTEALVQWSSLPPEDATWEEVDVLRQQFPNLDLEDKDRVQGGAIDRNREKRSRKPNPRYLD